MHIAKLHKYRCVEDLGGTIVAIFDSRSQRRRIEVGSSLRDMHGSSCLCSFVPSIKGTVKHLACVPMGAPLPYIGAMAGYSSAFLSVIDPGSSQSTIRDLTFDRGFHTGLF